jgi:hypothetical protein
MSSLNCLYYENKKNNNLDIYKKITTEIRIKIGELIKDTNKINSLENYWLNLILDEVPNTINYPNIHLFHSFFNNLFDKLRVNNEKLKNIIQEVIFKNFFELFDVSLNERQIENILEDDVYKSSNNIIKLFNSPKNFIKDIIIENFSNKFKEICKGENFDNLEKELGADKKVIPELQNDKNNENNKNKINNNENINKELKKLLNNVEFEKVNFKSKKFKDIKNKKLFGKFRNYIK